MITWVDTGHCRMKDETDDDGNVSPSVGLHEIQIKEVKCECKLEVVQEYGIGVDETTKSIAVFLEL